METAMIYPSYMASKKPRPVSIVDNEGDRILIQIQEKRRDAKGRLQFKRSKSLTVTGLTLEDVERIFRHACKAR